MANFTQDIDILAYRLHETMFKRVEDDSSDMSLELKMPPYSEIAKKYIIQRAELQPIISNRTLIIIINPMESNMACVYILDIFLQE